MSILFYFFMLYHFGLCSATTGTPTFTDPRDGEVYPYVQLEDLYWFQENLRFQAEEVMSLPDRFELAQFCGAFYKVEQAFDACPEGWRLPTEKEVKKLLKADKRGRISLSDTLQIQLCGRIDYGKIARVGQQNTFWMKAELKKGHITHWHTFGTEQELHSHNVVVAERQFPIRCVSRIKVSGQ